ncbi:amino acid adenylation domain-containing protein [Dyella sp. GSA-30]|uniref:non-ribosomal peptide synthetase n=1 Tax=Dyella sp. GSA-30 TaxID=2994496 RepID=UPI002490B376|nr:amino acid adenylation domain-containing protein [Dyella sp. GSA-30]BDU21603.1 hypothetical protein DYGSA30_30600 [Dyella sp. GSA-30]
MTTGQGLSPEKEALLAKRLKGALGKQNTAMASARLTNAEEGAPLSFGQQRLWFIDQFESGQTHYNISQSIRMRGALDVNALRRSLNEVVRRHEMLRTVFEMKNGVPRQVAHAHIDIPLPVVDLDGMSETEQRARVSLLRHEQASLRFDLTTGPLLRLLLLSISPLEHVLLFTIHHIAYDAWSQGILIRELGILYEAFTRGEASPLPELSAQYADYALWERRWLDGEVTTRQLGYWKERLGNAPQLLSLPLDRPRPPIQTHNGEEYRFSVDPVICQKLKGLARENQATLFMVLAAAFSVFLSRYSGQEDICIGTPVANRNNAGSAPLIGFFVNTLVLRTQVDWEVDFSELLRQVRKHALDAYEHQDLPFERLVDGLKLERNVSFSPLYQVMLVLQNAYSDDLRIGDLDIEVEIGERFVAKHDLTLDIMEIDDGLLCCLEYNIDLFERETAARMMDNFVILLSSIVASPRHPIGRLKLLSDSEQRKLLRDFNATRQRFPQDVTIHQLFERYAARHPDAIALEFEGLELTYAETNRRANRLAHHLIEQGIRPGDRVAICMERSTEMVVGLIAVLKAGAAYVPLDPDYPIERLQFMLDDSEPALMLAHEPTRRQTSELRSMSGWVVVDADDTAFTGIAQHDPDSHALGIHAQNLAYIIYTSGSTGQPKGVMNQHDGVVNRLLWAQQQFALTPTDRVLQKTPFSFDVSVWEFFLPLLSGARLVLASPRGHKDPHYLSSIIAQRSITVVHFVPPMLHAFLNYGDMRACGTLRHVLCSGEALPRTLQIRFHGELPRTSLHNLYGPTEAAVDVTYWHCQPDEQHGSVPIGRSIANTQIYVLDRFGQPAPIGVVGELYIGGIQVARGYLKRPQLTEERFVEDRLGDLPGMRLYRTGDLARYGADGVLEYCGRTDFQVKLRGFRIELGEIEMALARIVEVSEAAVTVLDESGDDKQLVAYVRMSASTSKSEHDLRQALSSMLPEHMLPGHIVMIDRFPLTANGKLDRTALPRPGKRVTKTPSEPCTPTQRLLSSAWMEVLKVEDVGIHQNFFELGGHSLLLLQLHAILCARLGIHLQIVDLFQYPTIEKLSWFIDRLSAGGLSSVAGVEPQQETPRASVEPLVGTDGESVAR